jgi:hypothetical protein
MPSYILSNANRLYVGTEQMYGQAPGITSGNRIPAVKLATKQEAVRLTRKDKTGSRTFPGMPSNLRYQTSFDLKSYMTAWTNQAQEPAHGPLFEAALGGSARVFGGGTAGGNSGGQTLAFAAAHGLSAGQAMTFGGEIRFASAIIDPLTVQLNAPFTLTPSAGSPIGPAVTYQPATSLPSVSLFDYWSPSSAVHRVLCGAAVDKMRIAINGDFHEFEFSGLAMDLIDSASFEAGQGQMQSFPAEPAIEPFDYTIIPGHLGQAWLDNTPDRFFTITAAELTVGNGLDLRSREFGSNLPRAISAGTRTVTLDFDLLEQDTDATKGLYQSARQRSPMEAMFQLGQQEGQLFGAYLKSVTPETPQFNDSETRLEWRFSGSRAQGTVDDEVFVAFG